jgi:hypothetical protein
MNAVAGRFVTIGRMSGVLKGELDFDLRIRQQRESCAASRSHQKNGRSGPNGSPI